MCTVYKQGEMNRMGIVMINEISISDTNNQNGDWKLTCDENVHTTYSLSASMYTSKATPNSEFREYREWV